MLADSLPDVFDKRYTGLAGITRIHTAENKQGRKTLAFEMTHSNYAKYDLQMYRQMLFSGRDQVVIRDYARSNNRHQYSQLLHLAPDAVVTPMKSGFTVRWPHHGYFLVIISNHDDYQLIKGQKKPLQGWFFPAFDQIAEAPVLVLRKSGKRCRMTCSISIGMRGIELDTARGYGLPLKRVIRGLEKTKRRILIHQPYPEIWKPHR